MKLEATPIWRRNVGRWATLAVLSAAWLAPLQAADKAPDGATATVDPTPAVEARLNRSLHFLASDELEGRGPGTDGIKRAAEFIAEEFKSMGLKTDVFDGGPYQKFTVTVGSHLGKTNDVAFSGPPGDKAGDAGAANGPTKLELGKDFNPLAMGGSGQLDLPIVFVGYGVSAPDEKFDEYAGVDVKDKAVLVIRRLPQQGNPHSPLGGDANHSVHAPFTRKISNAYQHGAKAVIFVTDATSVKEKNDELQTALLAAVDRAVAAKAKLAAAPDDEKATLQKTLTDLQNEIVELGERRLKERDPVLEFSYGGGGESRDFPVLHITREAADKLLKSSLNKSLADVEAKLDADLTPQSQELTGWKITGEVSVDRETVDVMNVVGVLEGQGPHADETIVIGAHYDHLGRGGNGSLQPGSKEIHNGADDNASGTASLIEVARLITSHSEKPGRRIVFVAFTCEEMGLIGSQRFVSNPPFPLDKTIAMLNMDMVGRLRNKRLVVFGTGTASVWEPLLSKLNEKYGFDLAKNPEGFGPSDHSSFYSREIPVLHFFTDTHEEYHTPRDDADKIEYNGAAKIAEFVADVAEALATESERPKYIAIAATAKIGMPKSGSSRPYFGSIPAYGTTVKGLPIQGVSKDGPADKGGIKSGDVIVGLGENQIGGIDDFDTALRKFKAGDEVEVTVQRGAETVKLKVVLAPPR